MLTLVVLSKFSVAAKKVVGSVNPAKLIKDQKYATEVFERVDALGDEDLILLSLGLQRLLGLLNPPVHSEGTSVAPQKYMMDARS